MLLRSVSHQQRFSRCSGSANRAALDFRFKLRCTCAVKQTILVLLACVICASAAVADTPKPPRPSDGTFVGLEPIPNLHEQPGDHWFHENTLRIKGNVVTLSKEPVVFYQGKKLPSDSEGGFYKYRGTLSSAADGSWQVKLRLIESDYEEEPAGKDGKVAASAKSQQFPVVRAGDGSLQIDKVTYKKSKPK